jgi:large subunit ribosomal protein L29
MQNSEIRALSDEKILDRIEDLKEAMYILRRDASTGELRDTNQFRQTRRDIARLKTVLRERELAAQIAEKEQGNA